MFITLDDSLSQQWARSHDSFDLLLVCTGFFLPVIPALAAVNLSDVAAKTHLRIFNTSLVESTFTTTSSWQYTHRDGCISFSYTHFQQMLFITSQKVLHHIFISLYKLKAADSHTYTSTSTQMMKPTQHPKVISSAVLNRTASVYIGYSYAQSAVYVHKVSSWAPVVLDRCGWTKEGLLRQAKRKCAASRWWKKMGNKHFSGWLE